MSYQSLVESGIPFTLYADGVEIPLDATGTVSWSGSSLILAAFAGQEITMFFPVSRDIKVILSGYSAATYNSSDKATLHSEPDPFLSTDPTQSSTTVISPTTNIAENAQMLRFYVGNGGSNLTSLSMAFSVQIAEDAQTVSYNCDCDTAYPSQTLAQMRRRLLIGLGYAATASNPPNHIKAEINQLLEQAQMMVYEEYSTFRMSRFYRWELQQGVRFYDLDGNADSCQRRLDPGRIEEIGIEDGQQWYHLRYGIPMTLYTNPDQQARPTRYAIRQCIELWPAPADDNLILRIKGQFGLKPLIDDADVTTVDWLVVYLRALFMGKSTRGHPDADKWFSLEQERIASIVAGSHFTARYIPGCEDVFDEPRPIFLPLV